MVRSVRRAQDELEEIKKKETDIHKKMEIINPAHNLLKTAELQESEEAIILSARIDHKTTSSEVEFANLGMHRNKNRETDSDEEDERDEEDRWKSTNFKTQKMNDVGISSVRFATDMEKGI